MIKAWNRRRAQRALQAAQEAHDKARKRGDTRSIGTTHKRLSEALNAVMRLEVGA